MENKNIYYIQVTFMNKRNYQRSGIYNPLVIVIADSEDDAKSIITKFLYKYHDVVEVTLPYTIDQSGNRVMIDNIADFGHGKNVREYLTDPDRRYKQLELLDKYKDHYKRYDLQLFDDRGEILVQNDYTQDPNFTMPPQPPKNIMVILPLDQIDRLESGVGLVGDEEEGKTSGLILIAKKTTYPDGSYRIDQCLLGPDGSTKVRHYDSKTDTWSEWQTSESSYVLDAPIDTVEYVRKDGGWSPLEYDTEPTTDSEKLVKSGNLKTYIEDKVAKLFKYMGTVDTLNDLPTDNLKIGYTYNIKEKSTLIMTVDGQEITISVDAGDNVAWNGKYWDNLSGFVDVDSIYEYIDNAIKAVEDPSLGAGYQKIVDDKLETDSKVITTAINEVNDKTTNVRSDLVAGWNTVKLGKLFPISWMFLAKPYCYTAAGISVDYYIRNFKDNVVDNNHAFEIYVSDDCTMDCTVSPHGTVPGVYADYMLVSYYYTGVDGVDLDTVTAINSDGKFIGKTGFGTPSKVIRSDTTNEILAKWSGDNRGGGTDASHRYYEQVIIDLNAVRRHTDKPLDVDFYAAWWSRRDNGYVNSEFICYTGEIDMETITVSSTYQFDLSSLTQTYKNPTEMRSYVASKAYSGAANQYLTAYTPMIRVTIEDSDIVVTRSAEKTKHTFTVSQLS